MKFELEWYYYIIVNYAIGFLTFLAVRKWQQRNKNVKVAMSSYILGMHFVCISSIVRFFQIENPGTMFLEFFIWGELAKGVGITAACHRLWSHRAYKARAPLKILMMIWNSIANQGTILHWSTLHRSHHKNSDTDADPHSSSKGIFYCHMGWLLFKKTPEQVKEIKSQNIDDLLDDKIVMFQHNKDPYWNQFWCFIVPTIYAYYKYNDALSGFLIIGVLRWIWNLHCTWTVNSLAHFYGYKPYNKNIPPVESLFTTLLAVGEGWHNWHHVYPYDYAAAEGGIFAQWNPTKLFIDLMASIGQAYDLRRAIHTD